MATYCRITGKSRGLPKPHYFPLLPPISPADAKRLCRITGKSYGLPTHHYIPVFTRHSKRLKRIASCPVTSKAETQEAHHYLPAAGIRHTVLKDFRYLLPVFKSNGDLLEILNKKNGTSFDGERECEIEHDRKSYVYAVHERQCGIIFPSVLEAAVRDGDIRDIMLAKHADTLLLKLRKGDSVEVDVRETSVDEMDLYEGEGPSTGSDEKKKRKRVDTNEWRRKIFEDKEREADDQEQQCARRIKPKRVKVKLDHICETVQKLSSWKNVLPETVSQSRTSSERDEKLNECLRRMCAEHCDPRQLIRIRNGKPCSIVVRSLPMPTKCGPEIIDLSHSLPGIIQQPLINGDDIAGLPILAPAAPFQPFVPSSSPAIDEALKLLNTAENKLRQLQTTQLSDTSFVQPTQIRGVVKSIVNFIEMRGANDEQKNPGVVEIDVDGVTKRIPGTFIRSANGEEIFVPGKVFSTPNGLSFVPGLEIRIESGDAIKTKFLPGRIFVDQNATDNSNEPVFVVGQTVLTRTGEQFVPGQTVLTKTGTKFVPGQTIITTGNDMRFVPGQIIEDGDSENPHRFIPGHTIVTSDGTQFVAGKFVEFDPKTGEVEFMPGQYVLNENFNWEFVSGHTVKTDDSGYVFVAGKEIVDKFGCGQFVPGQMIFDELEQTQQFVPGITVNKTDGSATFVPCMKVQIGDDSKFVEGMLTKDKNDSFAFVAGIAKEGENEGAGISFQPASNPDEIVFLETAISNSGVALTSVAATDQSKAEVFGHLVQSSQGVEFFPGEATGLPAGKVIPGRLVKGKDKMRFIPGTMVDNKFIPGQLVTTDKEERFVPGQVIEMKDGPKFVPGQVLNTRSGPKFVPGQTMDTKNGPKFIPGQIIETKSGPTFIPGQVIFTEEEGSRFVPGQVVDTVEGPRFVPGRVVETGDYITFIPGQIVETEDGLKFVAPDLEDDPEGGYQFTVQGFEVAQEELNVIQRDSIPYTCFTGETAIDSKMIKQLSEAGMAVGRQMPIDIPEVDIKPLPFTELACILANRLDVDSSCMIKMSHILSNLHQIEAQSVIQTLLRDEHNVVDKRLRPFIDVLSTCKNVENEGEELLRLLGETLENVINASPNSKMDNINELHTLTTQLACQARDIQLGSLLPKLTCELVCQVANELNMDAAHAIKMGQILSNLCQITRSNLAIDVDAVIEDEDTKSLLKIAFDFQNANPEGNELLFQALGESLETKIRRDPERKSQLIDKIHSATANLSTKTRRKSRKKRIDSTIEKAVELADKLDLSSTKARKLMKILSNVGHIDSLKAIFLSKVEGDDSNGELLNKLIDIKRQNRDWNDFMRAAGETLKNAFENDDRDSNEIVESLYEATEKVATNINTQQIKDILSVAVIEESDKIISELNVDPAMLPKLSRILSNLGHIQSSELTTLGNNACIDHETEILLRRTIAKNGDKATLKDLAAILKTVIRGDNNIEICEKIDRLDAVCADVSAKIVQQQTGANNIPSSFIMEMVHKIADKRNIRSPTEVVKIGRILSNLYQINLTKTPILQQSPPNSAVRTILKSAAEKMTATQQRNDIVNNSDEQLMRILAEELDNVIANADDNFEDKLQIIAGLDDCTRDLATSATEEGITKNMPILVLEKVNRIVAKLDGSVADTSAMIMKMGQVITNLQKIKRASKTPIFSQCTEDVNFEKLLNATINFQGEADDQQLLDKLGAILEDTILANSSQPDKVLESMHSLATKLATNVRDAEIKDSVQQSVIETTSRLADELDLSSPHAAKLRETLSSLCEIVASDGVTINVSKIKNNALKVLLENVCSKDMAAKKMHQELAPLLAEQIKKLIVQNSQSGTGAHLVDILHASVVNLTRNIERARISEGSSPAVLQTACQIVSKLQLEPAKLIKMVNILSNLQQIGSVDLSKMEISMDNSDVKTLVEIIRSADQIGVGEIQLFEKVALVLEKIVTSDADNMEQTVDTLDSKIMDLAVKINARKRNNLISQSSLTTACELATKLAVDCTNVTKLGRILSNMEAIQSANVSNSFLVAILDATTNEHLQELVSDILEYQNEQNNNLPPAIDHLAHTLEKIIVKNPKMKVEIIAELEKLTGELASQVEVEKCENLSSEIITVANEMAVNMSIPNQCVKKLARILSNVNQIGKSNTAILCPKSDDPLCSKLIEAVMVADQCANGKTTVFTVAKAIEEIIQNDPKNKVEIISQLEALTTDAKYSIIDQTHEQEQVFTDIVETAIKVASKLKTVPPQCIPKLCQILNDVQRMNESNIIPIVSDDVIKNNDANTLLKISRECKENKISEQEMRQKLGSALVKILNANPQKAELIMENILTSTADLSEAIDRQQARDLLPSMVIHVAAKLAERMKISAIHVPKLTETLINLQNIIESNGEGVENQELDSLLHLAIEFRNEHPETSILQCICHTLENCVKKELGFKAKLQKLDALHESSSSLVQIIQERKFNTNLKKSHLSIASKIVEKLGLQPGALSAITKTIANLQNATLSNSPLLVPKIHDRGVEKIFKAVFSQNLTDRKTPSELFETLERALNDVLEEDLEGKMETVNELSNISAGLAAEVEKKKNIRISSIEESATKVAHKLGANVAQQSKINNILSNLNEIRQNNVIIPENYIIGKDMKILVETLRRDDLNDTQLVSLLAEKLELIVETNDAGLQCLEILDAATANLSIIVQCEQSERRIPRSVVESIVEMAGKLNLKPAQVTKLAHVISDMQKMATSNATILTDKIENKHFKMLISVLNEKGTSSELTKAAEKLFENYENETIAIDSLCAFTKDINSKIKKGVATASVSPLIIETATKIIKECQLKPSQCSKLCAILAGLQRVENIESLVASVCNDHLKTLLEAVISNNKTNPDRRDSLKLISSLLERVLQQNAENQEQILDSLYADVIGLVATSSRQTRLESLPLTMIETAGRVSQKLNADSTIIGPIAAVLSNICEIQKTDMPIPNDEKYLRDENLQTLLRAIPKNCDLESSLPRLEHTFQGILEANPKIVATLKVQTDSLRAKMLATQECFEKSLILDLVKNSVETLKLNPESAKKMVRIVSNVVDFGKSKFAILGANIEDKRLQQLLNVAVKCADENLISTVVKTLEDILEHEKNKDKFLSDLDELVLHQIRFDVVGNERLDDISVQIVNHAGKLASKFKLVTSCVAKLCKILHIVQQIGKSKAILSEADIEDENLRVLLKAATIECDQNEEKLSNNIRNSIESILMEAGENKRQMTIEQMHSACIRLADCAYEPSTKCDKLLSAVQIAGAIVQNTNLDTSTLPSLVEIVSNLLKIKTAVTFEGFEIDNKQVESLLKTIAQDEKENPQSPAAKIVGYVLQKVVQKDARAIETLLESTSNVIAKIQQQNLDPTKNLAYSTLETANKVVSALGLQPSAILTVNDIVSNFLEAKSNSVESIRNLKMENTTAKAIFNKVLNDENSGVTNGTFLQILEKVIGDEAGRKMDTVDKLFDVSSDIASNSSKQKLSQTVDAPTLIAASRIVTELDVDSSQLINLARLLANLDEIRKSNVTVLNDINDKNLKIILHSIEYIEDDVRSEKFTQNVTKMLLQIIDSNPGDKRQTIEMLCDTVEELTSRMKSQQFDDRFSTDIIETSLALVNCLDIAYSSPQCIKLRKMLSDIREIKLSSFLASIKGEIENADVERLLNFVNECEKPSKSVAFLRLVADQIENIIRVDLDHKTEKIDSLSASIADLVLEIRRRQTDNGFSLAMVEMACDIAKELKLSSCSLKIGGILSNLRSLQNTDMAWCFEDNDEYSYPDNNGRKFLKMALENQNNLEALSGQDFTMIIKNALENTIGGNNDDCKRQIIDGIHSFVVNLAAKVKDEEYKAQNAPLTIDEAVIKLANKLNVCESYSQKLGLIVSNLIEIKRSGVVSSALNVEDANIKFLLDLIPSNDDSDIQLAKILTTSLERLIIGTKNEREIIDVLSARTDHLTAAIRAKQPNKMLMLKNIIKNEFAPRKSKICNLMALLNEDNVDVRVAFQHMSEENPDFVNRVLKNTAKMLEKRDANEVANTLHQAIVNAVAETSERKVHKLMARGESKDFRTLVNEAIGLAKALGLSEIVVTLHNILKDGTSTSILAKDAVVMEVLKRLTIMRQLAVKNPALTRALHELQLDPYAARDDPRVRELVRESAVLMVIPEEELRSSEDIPCSLLFSDNSLAVEDFMVKRRQGGKTFLILKKGTQMVVPREAAKDVLTGKVPYTVLDENGIQYFKPLHVFNALKLPRFATNRFSNYGYAPRIPAKTDRQLSAVLSYGSGADAANAMDGFHLNGSGMCSTQEALANKNACNQMKNRLQGESSYRC